MSALANVAVGEHAKPVVQARAGRDAAVDGMRGVAILMVIGIHSLQQPLALPWALLVDAALRPCVPVFLFVSGLLTARSGRVPLRKRLLAVVVPYAIAFASAYAYMAVHNPAMDHRITTTLARFFLAYVSVYYYVFVYAGCVVLSWLAFRAARPAANGQAALVALMLLAILVGLLCGAYLDPTLSKLSLSPSLIEEARMRDVPFWFGFFALGALFDALKLEQLLQRRMVVVLAAAGAYAIYAAVRLFDIGDAADYDSVAYFVYAGLFCIALAAFRPPTVPLFAALGSGSYFLYLWHIFVIWILRDHTSLYASGALTASLTGYAATVCVSVAALIAIRSFFPARVAAWLGA